MKFLVTNEEHGWTLLAFLKEKCKEGLSSNAIKKAIAGKSCKVNGRVEVFSTYQLRQGESVEFLFEAVSKAPVSIPILFEDPYFAVIDKPAGVLSLEEPICQLLGAKAKTWHLVHRLDKETSGALLLAKSAQAFEAAKDLFSRKEVVKIYLALVDGKIKEKEGTIDNYLGKKGGYEGQTLYGAVPIGGQRAITSYRCLAYGKRSSLLSCDLKTGRTHQIRVHFSEKGHPLLGDWQYAKKRFECPLEPSRHLLHAWKLSFPHPFLPRKVEIESPVPDDFLSACKELGISSVFAGGK